MKWLKIPLYALTASAVFILAASFTVKFLVTDESTVACPDVTGLDIGEAKQQAAQKGLYLIIGKYETKKDVPYNRVLFQTPDPAMPVRAGRTVTVVLSDGPVPVIIPAFVGLTLEEAQAALADRGMKLKKVINVPGGDANRVVAQIPGSGENVLNEEGMVLLVGGRERRFYVMPEVAPAVMPASCRRWMKSISGMPRHPPGFPMPRMVGSSNATSRPGPYSLKTT